MQIIDEVLAQRQRPSGEDEIDSSALESNIGSGIDIHESEINRIEERLRELELKKA